MISAPPIIGVTPASPPMDPQGHHAFKRHSHQPSLGGYVPPTGPTHQRGGFGSTGGSISYAPNAPSPFAPTLPKPDPDAPLERLRRASDVLEDHIETISQPMKPYLPALGRFLIVVTFLEDTLRIMTQWSDQIYYLQRHRHIPWGLNHIFLFANVIVMLSCSSLVIAKRWPEKACAGLLAVVIAQGFGYGLIFDLNFFLRNLSVVGGLLMVVSESLSKRKSLFAGLPQISEDDRKHYVQLTGRVLLIFLFIGFVFNGSFTLLRAVVSVLGLCACVMVAIGFKAKSSAFFLVLLLSVFNVFVNNWWAVHASHPQRDFLKYDFYQTLSVVGGLLLLVNMGAGGISMDAKKKH